MTRLPGTSFFGKIEQAAAVTVAILLLASCGSSSQTVTAPSTQRCGLQVQSDSSTFPTAGGSGTLRVTTNRECAWSARADAAWLGLTAPSDGQGDGSVRFTVAANGDPLTRKGGISVNDERMEVSQVGRPCEFHLSSKREVVDPSGGDRSIQVAASSAQCEWTAAPVDAWITINSGGTGKGNGTVSFHVSAVSGPPRTGTLTVAGESVLVEQGTGCSYSIVGGSVFSVGTPGGFLELPVSAPPGCGWTAESPTRWIAIRGGASGSGSGHVRLAIEANDGSARQGSVTIAGSTVSIVQDAGCSYLISPSAQDVGGSGGSAVVSIATAAGCPWTATSLAEWIGVSAQSGEGPAQLQVSAAANPGIARTGSLTIASHTFTLNQASLCTFDLVPPHFTYDAAGGNGAVLVIVSGPCTWNARSNADWISMSSGSPGQGNGLVQFVVLPNTGQARTSSVAIAGLSITVTQSGQ